MAGIKNPVNVSRDIDGELIIKRAAKSTFRDKILNWSGKDPLKWKNCGRTMEMVKVWVDGVGTVFDYLDDLERAPPILNKTHVSKNDQEEENFNFQQITFPF